MRVHRNWPIVALALATALTGCAKKQAATMTTSNDSLVAANPQEQGQGSMTPQTSTMPPATETTPPPAPAPVSTPPAERHRTTTPTTHHRTTHETSTSSEGTRSAEREAPGITVPSGTNVSVNVNTLISSETAQVGDSWTGVVKDAVMVDGRTVIPAGSTVTGTVTQVTPAARGSRASLDLAMSSIEVEGHSYNVHGGAQGGAIVAGSTRARNIGAVVGGAGAGALIGKAVGGGKGALIGGLLGGAAAGGAVAKSKGYQVVIKEGTNLTFTTSENVSIRS